MHCICSYQPLFQGSWRCPRLPPISFFMLVHMYGVAGITIRWPVVPQRLSNTTLYVIIYNTSSYHKIQPPLFLPFLAPLGSSLPFSLSISAGYNPCCLCSGDRSLLSANHSSYLTSEMLHYLPFHSQSGVGFQSSAVLMNYLFLPPSLPVPPPSASSLRTEDLRSVFTTLLHCLVQCVKKKLHAVVLRIIQYVILLGDELKLLWNCPLFVTENVLNLEFNSYFV